MKAIFSIGIFWLNFFLIQSQTHKISGLVIDNHLDIPIKYANIGILNTPIGTVTNEKGEFLIYLNNPSASDTIKISCLGFKSKKIPLHKLLKKSTSIIKLEIFSEQLEEVFITNKKLETITKGKTRVNTKIKVNYAISNFNNFNLGSQIGRKFIIGKKQPSLIESIGFFIAENNFKSVKFRVNIYSVEKNKPSKKLNDSDIILSLDNSYSGWVNFNLEQYDIIIQQNIIVAIEWISSSKDGNKLSLPLIMPSLNSIHYYKFASQAKWKRFLGMSSPIILTYKQ